MDEYGKLENDNTENSPQAASHYHGSKMQTSKAESIRSSLTHKSKYTTSSKLTRSQLHRTISKTTLMEKN